MMGQRRLSQAISEGDGISLITPAPDADAAIAAERGGAEGVVLDANVSAVRDATGLPILWRVDVSPGEALTAGADALLLGRDGVITWRKDRKTISSLLVGNIGLNQAGVPVLRLDLRA